MSTLVRPFYLSDRGQLHVLERLARHLVGLPNVEMSLVFKLMRWEADNQPRKWIDLTELGILTGFSRKRLIRAVHHLRDRGMLRLQVRHKKIPWKRTHRYSLDLHAFLRSKQ